MRTVWATGFEDECALPGMVISIQTFGYFANFHPHLHALVTNGVLTRDGRFLDLPRWTPRVVEELFWRVVLKRVGGDAGRAWSTGGRSRTVARRRARLPHG